ncbi:hypothetical protein PG984_006584 [Apiospora sp. TS-2023a]
MSSNALRLTIAQGYQIMSAWNGMIETVERWIYEAAVTDFDENFQEAVNNGEVVGVEPTNFSYEYNARARIQEIGQHDTHATVAITINWGLSLDRAEELENMILDRFVAQGVPASLIKFTWFLPLPALTEAQREQIKASWLRSGQTNLWGVVHSRLLNSAMLLGGRSLSSHFPTWWEDDEFVDRIENTRRNAVTLVEIPGSPFRTLFALLGMRPTDRFATVAITTSWEVSREQKAELVNKVAEVLGDPELSSRIKFVYGSCRPPAQ